MTNKGNTFKEKNLKYFENINSVVFIKLENNNMLSSYIGTYKMH